MMESKFDNSDVNNTMATLFSECLSSLVTENPNNKYASTLRKLRWMPSLSLFYSWSEA